MKQYVKPMLSVESFKAEDIITTSLIVGGSESGGGTLDFGGLQ
jgi:hypothetical protein